MSHASPTSEPDAIDLSRWEDDGGFAAPERDFEFKRENSQESAPGIYQILADHQRHEEWRHKSLLVDLHRWAVIFECEFALGIPELALAIDRLRCTTLGQFRYGHNGFGLKGEIIINHRHLEDEYWEVLGTLLHELIHGWQQAYGKPGRSNYHNKQFREKARLYGLIIDYRGYTQYEPESLFLQVLERHGIRVPQLPAVTPARRHRGKSKLKKWSCRCVPPINLRAAIEIDITCNRCGQVFQLAY